MKINLHYEKYRKDIIDIFRIFSKKDLEFGQDGELEIFEDHILSDSTLYFYSKLELKQILYKYFSQIYGSKSPWGIITGTKPQKLYMIHSEEELSKNYYISTDKIDLLRNISKEQEKFTYNKENLHLYVNIPFCPSRCSYCSFPTIIYTKNDRRSEYLNGLLYEIRALSAHIGDRLIRSVYIGGGTPTAFSYHQLEELLIALKDSFDLRNLEEFTIEAGREDSLDADKLALMKEYGVTRISINPQSFNPNTNELIGRRQDLGRLKDLYKLARDMGFIVNMDLIIGLCGEDIKDVENSLDEIEQLMPHNLTIHTLSLKKGSKMVDKKLSLETEGNLIEDIVEYSYQRSTGMKYHPYYLYRQKEILGNYENIGYSLRGYDCLYNIVINEEVESILGMGMTANSKLYCGDRLFKCTNYKNLDQYLSQLDQQINNKIKILNFGA